MRAVRCRSILAAARLASASRPGYGAKQDSIHRFIRYGASPRAAQYLILGAKARAILAGRFHVDFADVRAVANPVLRHRLVTSFRAESDGVTADLLTDINPGPGSSIWGARGAAPSLLAQFRSVSGRVLFFQSSGFIKGWGRDIALPLMTRIGFLRRQMIMTMAGIKSDFFGGMLPL